MSFLSRLFKTASSEQALVPEGDPLRLAEVEAILEELRPLFRADGGDMQIVRISDNGDVAVRLIGACGTCSLSSLTLRGALEPKLRERISWFRELHAA